MKKLLFTSSIFIHNPIYGAELVNSSLRFYSEAGLNTASPFNIILIVSDSRRSTDLYELNILNFFYSASTDNGMALRKSRILIHDISQIQAPLT